MNMKQTKVVAVLAMSGMMMSMLTGCGSVAGEYTEEVAYDTYLADETGYAFEDASFSVNASLSLGEEGEATYTVEKTDAMEQVMDIVLDQIDVPATAILADNDIVAADYADYDAYVDGFKSELKDALKAYIDEQEDDEFTGTYEAKDGAVSFTSDDFKGEFTLDRSSKDAMTFAGDLEEDWLEDYMSFVAENIATIGESQLSPSVSGTYIGEYELSMELVEAMMGGIGYGRTEPYILNYELTINDDQTSVLSVDVASFVTEFQEDIVNNIDSVLETVFAEAGADTSDMEALAVASGYDSYDAMKEDMISSLEEEIDNAFDPSEDFSTTGTWTLSDDGAELTLDDADGDTTVFEVADGSLTAVIPGLMGDEVEMVFEKVD